MAGFGLAAARAVAGLQIQPRSTTHRKTAGRLPIQWWRRERIQLPRSCRTAVSLLQAATTPAPQAAQLKYTIPRRATSVLRERSLLRAPGTRWRFCTMAAFSSLADLTVLTLWLLLIFSIPHPADPPMMR